MAELENNLESTEETVETVAEAGQPDAKAEKGDTKPVKQGSSDEEKIESGKGEVVKPEENPVDKSVASVKKAGDETKQVKDAVNKSAPAPEKSEKLKEDEGNHYADPKPQQAGIEEFYLFKDEKIYVGDLVSIKFSSEKGRAVDHIMAENRVHDSNIVQVAMNFPDVLSDEFFLREKEIAAIEIRNIPKESLVLEEKGVDRALEEQMIGHKYLHWFNKMARLGSCRSKSAYILYHLSTHFSIKEWAESASYSSWHDHYRDKTVDRLKDACRSKGLKTSGNKESLVSRLAFLMSRS